MRPNRLLPLLLLGLLAACHTAKKTVVTSKKAAVNTADLNGSWQLDYLNGAGINFDQLYVHKKPFIRFEVAGLRASGNTGCNNFSGALTIDGSKISFNQPLTLTKMFCEGQGEPVFLESLKRITAWALIDTSTLTLVAGDEVLMRLVKMP